MNKFFVTAQKGYQFECAHIMPAELPEYLAMLTANGWTIENVERVWRPMVAA